MRKSSSFLVCLAAFCCSLAMSAGPAASQEAGGPSETLDAASFVAEPQQLFSPSLARKFYNLAYDLAESEQADQAETQQAIVFLRAAMKLDSGAAYVKPLLIRLASRYPEKDHAALVYEILKAYVDQNADIEVARNAVVYLVGRLNSREQRESFLEEALNALGKKNSFLESELATVLGSLSAEKPDLDAAGFYFAQACRTNRYNKAAFTRLAQLFPEKLGPELYVEHLRLALRENPLDIDAAVSFAQYLERLELYDTAVDAYEYSADLFGYLYPAEQLPARIYLPWAISSYNAKASRHKCLQIAKTVREQGRFDLMLESLAGKAAAKMGDGEQATRIFQDAEKKAQWPLLMSSDGLTAPPGTDPNQWQPTDTRQLAWFYCFALPNPQKALEWANKAYSIDPNSDSAASILAYALLMNDQSKYAALQLKNRPSNQIADLVRARIALAEDRRVTAIELFKSVIARDPGSLAAEQARDTLEQEAIEYVPPADPGVLMNVLEGLFGKAIVPEFTTPDRMIAVQLNIRGNEFPYGSDFGCVLAITNSHSEPLVMSDDGMLKGNIRVDAVVSGDLTKDIPRILDTRIRNSYLVAPGQSVLIPIRLVTGELEKMLSRHPQASLNISFTLYLDPVVSTRGVVTNRLVDLPPARLSVERPAVELTGKYLRSRFNQISKGQPGQKIKTAQLFIGLLMEQYAMSNRTPPYRFMYADWMPTMFRNALLHESGLLRNRTDGQWTIKTHTMAEMLHLPLHDDYELVAAVAESLNNANWPVRMMAVYLLAKTQKGQFDKVLDSSAKYDPSAFVRDMAVALGAPGKGASSGPAQAGSQIIAETVAKPADKQ
ncbi:MAG: hypothetical protein JSU94_21720 [Phycisphaerales bacterium]|nr:MAG: hypothetical protein JSU94_21720 [Phycisphaerales bacterium]